MPFPVRTHRCILRKLVAKHQGGEGQGKLAFRYLADVVSVARHTTPGPSRKACFEVVAVPSCNCTRAEYVCWLHACIEQSSSVTYRGLHYYNDNATHVLKCSIWSTMQNAVATMTSEAGENIWHEEQCTSFFKHGYTAVSSTSTKEGGGGYNTRPLLLQQQSSVKRLKHFQQTL